MTTKALKPTVEERDRAYRLRVKEEPLPAVIIDCTTATVLTANAGGLFALGLSPADRLPLALDSAMPAVTTLRDLHRRTFKEPLHQALIFWRHGRTSVRHHRSFLPMLWSSFNPALRMPAARTTRRAAIRQSISKNRRSPPMTTVRRA